jgi:peroxisomal 2,4-dienoyl-CoA reductase
MSAFRNDILDGRVALVTGGATGIGKEIAHTLGQHGARVCIASRNEENLAATAKELEADGVECMWASCDVREPAQVDAVVQAVLARWERIDILVNNAAGNFPAPITGLSPNGFKAVVDIDLRGTFHVTRAVFDAAMAERGGHIVNITAPFDGLGVALQAHAAAAKAGVDSLTRTCAVEFAPSGVRVNAVGPGAVGDTEGMERLVGGGAAGDPTTCPLGYIGSRQDIANAVLFLVSDAASYVTGQVLYVDGGASVDLMKLPAPGPGA